MVLSGVKIAYLVSRKKKQILSTNIDKKARIMLKKKAQLSLFVLLHRSLSESLK